MNISQVLTKLKALIYSKSETDSLLGGKANSSHTHTKSQITDFPSLATVATSGSYSDLSNKPTIPSDNNQLTNGAGYITSSGSCNYATSAGGVAWSNVSSRPYMVDFLFKKTIDGNFSTQYRTQTRGNTTQDAYLSVIRTNTTGVAKCPAYGSGIASGVSDTHFYIYCSYFGADAYIGGGNGDKLNWISRINVEDNTFLNGYRIYVG